MDATAKLVTTKKNQGKSKGGRPHLTDVAHRLMLVESMMLKGLTPTQMAELKIANYNTILKDVKKIQTRWLEQDTEWFHRARLARIEAEKALDAQKQRLFAYLEDTDDRQLSDKEKLHVESLILSNIDKKEDISTGMDPEEYIKNVVRERTQHEKEELEGKQTDTR